MDHYRLKKYRGPETWARVQEAYLAGEAAASVALRFDVSVANLRKRASREGWTRNRAALDNDLKPIRGARDAPSLPALPPPGPGVHVDAAGDRLDLESGVITLLPANLPPGLALERAMTDAARRLAEGRAGEAAALMRAAATLAELTGAPLPTLDQLDAAELGWEATDLAMAMVEARAFDMAGVLLSARDLPERALWAAHFHWRAARLGPEVAAADHARAVESGDAARLALWDADGRLKPLPPLTEAEIEAAAAMTAMARWFAVKGTTRGWWGEGEAVAIDGADDSVTA